MARMMPDVDPDTIPHESEAAVYQALQRRLSDDYLVLHSYPWLRPDRGNADAPLIEGEADFVVLHRERGMLVLEVKGGQLALEGRAWYRRTRGGSKPVKDPFDQGRRNVHALVDSVEERTGGQLRRGSYTFGYAAVFPHHDYEGPLPLNADPSILITARHLPYIEAAIEQAYRRWQREPRSLDDVGYRRLLDALLPRFRLYRPVGPALGPAATRLLQLTGEQVRTFEGLYQNERVLVEGAAGSGKTMLALERALAFARAGRRALLLCFNRELAQWLREQVSADPTEATSALSLEISTFHSIARDLASRAEIDFRPPPGPAQRFWDEEAPAIMEQAAAVLREAGQPGFEAVVVDEAQDFRELWWYCITDALLEDPGAPLYAFTDPHQGLRAGSTPPPPEYFSTRYKLLTNCRNTKRIASTSGHLISVPVSSSPASPTGVEPRIIRASSATQHKGLVMAEIRRLLQREGVDPKQIAVIGPRSMPKGSLCGVAEVEGVPLVTSAADWRAGQGILVTTARSFKGLEADVVILYDLGPLTDYFTEIDLYVCCTRARYLLITIIHDDQTRQRLARAVAAAEEAV